MSGGNSDGVLLLQVRVGIQTGIAVFRALFAGDHEAQGSTRDPRPETLKNEKREEKNEEEKMNKKKTKDTKHKKKKNGHR